jgi:hypothetical protein
MIYRSFFLNLTTHNILYQYRVLTKVQYKSVNQLYWKIYNPTATLTKLLFINWNQFKWKHIIPRRMSRDLRILRLQIVNIVASSNAIDRYSLWDNATTIRPMRMSSQTLWNPRYLSLPRKLLRLNLLANFRSDPSQCLSQQCWRMQAHDQRHHIHIGHRLSRLKEYDPTTQYQGISKWVQLGAKIRFWRRARTESRAGSWPSLKGIASLGFCTDMTASLLHSSNFITYLLYICRKGII